MIYVVFGNAPFEFTRLAIAVDDIAMKLDEEVIVQHGYTKYQFKYAKHEAFVDAVTMSNRIEKAALIITHGGWGTISECLTKHKLIVAVPRIKGIEHNHSQLELVQELEEMGCLLAVYNEKLLLQAVITIKQREFKGIPRGNAAEYINDFLSNAVSLR